MNIERTQLYQALPLETPFSLHVFPIFKCNFKCSYCLHSLSQDTLREMHFEKQSMDLKTYKKAIDDLREFPAKLKALVFAGHGEPLLHKDIAGMVAYAKQMNIADRIEIVTNGSLLTKELSDQLIAAGLDRLRISLQGVTAEKYKEVAGVSIDFNQFVSNIAYFYQNKIATDVYIKIIDVALKDDQQKQDFMDIFSPIADEVAVEYAIPFVSELDYSKVGDISGNCKQGNKVHSNVCSMPFYMLVLYPNGDVIPCCSVDVPIVYGNVLNQSLKQIWNTDRLKNFLARQLNGYRTIDVCRACSVPSYGLQEGDYLDGHEDSLRQCY